MTEALTLSHPVPGDDYSPLDVLLASSLSLFETWLLKERWRGKEHDCVNLFAHGFLFPHIKTGAAIEDFTQVAIEVPVPQAPGYGIKQAVTKDLVIWPSPRFITWDEEWRAVLPPMAVMEWKCRRKRSGHPPLHQPDIEWLKHYSRHFPNCTGYAVTVNFRSDERRIWMARIRAEGIREDFHRATT